MPWRPQRWRRDGWRSALCFVLLFTSLLLALSIIMHPGLRSLKYQLHAMITGSYVSGHHSVLLINAPNEQTAKDIGRAVMDRHLAASVNILPSTPTMYYWKGEIQDTSEALILLKTKTSKIRRVVDFVRSIHPYANPEVLSFAVMDGSLEYMKWMEETIPDD